MPTRKQRRRRAKEQRHEWEFVALDEEGREIAVDPADLRTKKEKEKSRPATTASRNGRPVQARDRRGRPLREAKPPSWRRSVQRAVLFAVVLFVITTFLEKNVHVLTRAAIALAYGAIGIPFFYFLDRATYHRWLRATGR